MNELNDLIRKTLERTSELVGGFILDRPFQDLMALYYQRLNEQEIPCIFCDYGHQYLTILAIEERKSSFKLVCDNCLREFDYDVFITDDNKVKITQKVNMLTLNFQRSWLAPETPEDYVLKMEGVELARELRKRRETQDE